MMKPALSREEEEVEETEVGSEGIVEISEEIVVNSEESVAGSEANVAGSEVSAEGSEVETEAIDVVEPKEAMESLMKWTSPRFETMCQKH